MSVYLILGSSPCDVVVRHLNASENETKREVAKALYTVQDVFAAMFEVCVKGPRTGKGLGFIADVIMHDERARRTQVIPSEIHYAVRGRFDGLSLDAQHVPIYEAVTYELGRRFHISVPDYFIIRGEDSPRFSTVTESAVQIHHVKYYFASALITPEDGKEPDAEKIEKEKLYLDLICANEAITGKVVAGKDDKNIYLDLGSFVECMNSGVSLKPKIARLHSEHTSHRIEEQLSSAGVLVSYNGKRSDGDHKHGENTTTCLVRIPDVLGSLQKTVAVRILSPLGHITLKRLTDLLPADEIESIRKIYAANAAQVLEAYKGDKRVKYQ